MKLQAHTVAWTVLWGLVSQWVDDLLKQQLYNKTSKWPTLWERYFCLLESLIFHQFAKLWIRNWFIFHRSCIINHELIKNPVVKVAGYSRWIATLSGILLPILWNAVLTHPGFGYIYMCVFIFLFFLSGLALVCFPELCIFTTFARWDQWILQYVSMYHKDDCHCAHPLRWKMKHTVGNYTLIINYKLIINPLKTSQVVLRYSTTHTKDIFLHVQ